MKPGKVLLIGMMALAPYTAKAQRAVRIIPEAGVFGNVREVPLLIYGANANYSTKKNSLNLF